MDTKDIKESIASAKKELENFSIDTVKTTFSMDNVKTTIEKLGKSLNETVAQVFGWNADYHFVERASVDVTDNYQTYEIVGNKNIKVLIPEESVDKTDEFTILVPRSEFGIREPNMMDIVYLRSKLYTVKSVLFKEEMSAYELTIQKYERISVPKGY